MKADGKSVIFTVVIHSGHCISPSPGEDRDKSLCYIYCMHHTDGDGEPILCDHNGRRIPLIITVNSAACHLDMGITCGEDIMYDACIHVEV